MDNVLKKKANPMHAYEFTNGGETYFLLAESTVKERTIKNQGKERLEEINNEIKSRYGVKRSNRYTIPFGTVLDSDYNVVSSPTVTQNYSAKGESEEVNYKWVDGTFVHIYRLGEDVMIGTRNSWNITKSYDLYNNLTYGDAFYSCLEKMGLVMDDLPNGSYVFSHPLLHQTAKQYRIYSFTIESIGDVKLSFDRSTEDDEEYLAYCHKYGYYREVISSQRTKLNQLLYFNRQRFRYNGEEVSDELSLLYCLLNFHCHANKELHNYVYSNKLFNDVTHECSKFITSIVRHLNKSNPNNKMYYGVEIPEIRNRASPLIPIHKGFWRDVITNAYWNGRTKGSCSVPEFSEYF